MLHKLGTKLTGLTLAAILGGAFLTSVAQATPITFYDNAGAQTGARFTVGCGGAADGDCTGLLVAVTSTNPLEWSATIGQMLGLSKSSEAIETAFVNGILDTTFTFTKDKDIGHIAPPEGNKESFEFSLAADYLLIKVGNGKTGLAHALLQNLGGDVDVWFTKTGNAGGLSHYITFGDGPTPPPTPVPEPATLGLFGLGALLIGGFLGLRRRYA